MSRRMITPYSEWPDYDYLEEIEAGYTEEDENGCRTAESSIRKMKVKKRRSRTKSSGSTSHK